MATSLQPFLAQLGLLEIADQLAEEGIENVETLAMYSWAELKEAGIKGGPAKRLLAGINEMSKPGNSELADSQLDYETVEAPRPQPRNDRQPKRKSSMTRVHRYIAASVAYTIAAVLGIIGATLPMLSHKTTGYTYIRSMYGTYYVTITYEIGVFMYEVSTDFRNSYYIDDSESDSYSCMDADDIIPHGSDCGDVIVSKCYTNKSFIIIGVICSVVAAILSSVILCSCGRNSAKCLTIFTIPFAAFAGFSYMVVWTIWAKLKNADSDDCGVAEISPVYETAFGCTVTGWILCWATAVVQTVLLCCTSMSGSAILPPQRDDEELPPLPTATAPVKQISLNTSTTGMVSNPLAGSSSGEPLGLEHTARPPASMQCGYASGTGRVCQRRRTGTASFCESHSCGVNGCTNSKSSREMYCSEHVHNDLYGVAGP